MPGNHGETFSETQHFTQWWLYLLILPIVVGSLGFIAVSTVQQLILGVPLGNQPMPNAWLIFTNVFIFLVGVVLSGSVLFMKLRVTIQAGSLEVIFWPLVRKSVPVSQITSLAVQRYSPLMDYGGWGIRRGRGGRWAYTIRGNEGVAVDLADGRKWLIGSRRARELADAIGSIQGRA